MRRILNRRLLYVFFVSGLTGLNLSRCKSVPIAEAIVRQEATNEKALDLVQKSNLTPSEKTFIGEALTKSLGMAKTENKRATVADAKAKDLEKYRNYVIAAALALAGFLFWRFTR